MSVNLSVWGFLAFFILNFIFLGRHFAIGQIQNFERDFVIADHPSEFLPGWSASEIRSTSSRIFQSNSEGIDGSRALAIQTISTFNAAIFVKVTLCGLENPRIGLFGKTKKNGTGTRPVSVYVSFSEINSDNFQYKIQIGDDHTFLNEDSDYRYYELEIPMELIDHPVVNLKLEVIYGTGSGSSARLFLDDFTVLGGNCITNPISISRARLLDPYTIELVMNKTIQLPNHQQVHLLGNIVDSVISPTDSTLLIKSIAPLDQSDIWIVMDNIKGLDGEESHNLNFTLPYSGLQVGEVIILQPDEMQVSFSQFFDPTIASQTGNYRINGKAPKTVNLLENGYIVELDLEKELTLFEPFELEVLKMVNDKGQESHNLKSISTYTDYLEEVFAKDPRTILLVHMMEVEFTSMDTAVLKLVEKDYKIQMLKTSGANNVVQLNLDKDLEENITYTLQIPFRETKRGNRISGSKRDFTWDQTPPSLVSVTGLSKNELLLVFSEPIDPAFAILRNNYVLGEDHPINAIPQENTHHVILTFSKGFENGDTYELVIKQIPDFAGNFIQENSFAFIFENPDQLPFKSLVINEVMPAPRDGNSLPNVEYIEILNISTNPIQLGGMEISNSRSSTFLPPGILEPEKFVILVPRTHVDQFTKYGSVLGLTNWPTLLNSSDQVSLKDKTGNVLDSLHYSLESYGSTSIAQGGFSLEIVNPYFPCYPASNLKPSVSPVRGTPGSKNSVFDDTPDRISPRLLSAVAHGDTTVELTFSKLMRLLPQTDKWTFSPHLAIKEIKMGTDLNTVILSFHEKLKEGIRYSLKVENIRDCLGNLISLDHQTTFFTLPSKGLKGDVILNEVLFNPRTGTPKFIEIYNASDKFINLKDWKLANLDNAGQVANRKVIFHEDHIIIPKSFKVFTTDINSLHTQYPKGDVSTFIGLSSLPSYPIASGNVVFLEPDEKFAEILSYSEKMHHVLLKEKRGVSLERLSFRTGVDDPENWQSASSTDGYATPGYKNSQNFENEGNGIIEIQPKVFIPDAAGEQNFTKISYRMKQSGVNATVRIYGINGLLIREICQNDIWGNEGFYIWDGTDQNSRKVRPGQYIVWVETFDMKGNVDQIKKIVVVGVKFY